MNGESSSIAPRVRTRTRFLWIGVAAAIVFGVVVIVTLVRLGEDLDEVGSEANRSIDEMALTSQIVDEMDRWPRLDAFASSSDELRSRSATRLYRVQRGVAPQQAGADLAAALRAHGYEDLASTSEAHWAGTCHTTRSCRLLIRVDVPNGRVLVALSA